MYEIDSKYRDNMFISREIFLSTIMNVQRQKVCSCRFWKFGVDKKIEFCRIAAYFIEKGGDIYRDKKKEDLKRTVRTSSKTKHVQKLELLILAETTKILWTYGLQPYHLTNVL